MYVDSVDPVAHKLAGPAAVRHDHRLQAVRADGQRARHAGGGGREECTVGTRVGATVGREGGAACGRRG